MKFPKFRLRNLMGSILMGSLCFASLRYASATWAGSVLFLTIGLLSWGILAAIYRQGAERAFWIGFALLGWVYFVLIAPPWWRDGEEHAALPTTWALSFIHPYVDPVGWPPTTVNGIRLPLVHGLLRDPDAINRPTRAMLARPVPMHFPKETPIEDVLKYISSATVVEKSLPWGLQFYVDPNGLTIAGKTGQSPVQIDVKGAPLRTTLKLVLDQIDMTYHVSDGVLFITSKEAEGPLFDPIVFLRIGHCWWALLIGLFGGVAARHLQRTSRRVGV